jgi:hypothetical protein
MTGKAEEVSPSSPSSVYSNIGIMLTRGRLETVRFLFILDIIHLLYVGYNKNTTFRRQLLSANKRGKPNIMGLMDLVILNH